jgi:hypothetical protein
MSTDLATALQSTIDREAVELCQVADDTAGVKPSPRAWSKKEELGHLIDSAANNHARFVRASLDQEYQGPGYEQDRWVALHAYNEMAWADIVAFWRQYNLFLARLVEHIPQDGMKTPCSIGSGTPVTLQFLIEDYIRHLQHHVDHILEREKITPYPGATPAV